MFFRNSTLRNGMASPHEMNKEGFLNYYLLKVLKLLVNALISFFNISNTMVKTFFEEQRCLI